jgi:hypothetical protein
MTTRLMSGILGAGAILVSLMTPSVAQESFWQSAQHLKLQYTNLKTGGPLDVHEGQCVPVVERMFFDCPGKRGSTCTVAVELSTTYHGITPGWAADLAVGIDGNSDDFGPVSAFAFATDVERNWNPNTATFKIIKKALTRGIHWLVDGCKRCYHGATIDVAAMDLMRKGVESCRRVC